MQYKNYFCSKNTKVQKFKKLLKSSVTLLGSAIMLSPDSLIAINYTVNRTDDPVVNSDGTLTTGNPTDISLRSAILQSNATGAPAWVVGTPNTITFDPGVFGGTSQTIQLNSELPLIFSNLTIDASTVQSITLDGGAPATPGSVSRGLFISGLPNPNAVPFTPNGTP